MTEIITSIEDIAEGVLSATIFQIDGKDHYQVIVNEITFTTNCADHTLDNNNYIMTGARYWLVEGQKVKAPEKNKTGQEPLDITIVTFATRDQVGTTIPQYEEYGPTPTIIEWNEGNPPDRIDQLDPIFNPYFRF